MINPLLQKNKKASKDVLVLKTLCRSNIREFNYTVIDSFTDSEIDPEEINKEKEGERHLILIPR